MRRCSDGLYMIIGSYRGGDAVPVYRRFRDQGRLAPHGLRHLASWVTADFQSCFQVMECSDPELLEQRVGRWRDLVDFEVVPMVTSSEAASALAPRLSRLKLPSISELGPHVRTRRPRAAAPAHCRASAALPRVALERGLTTHWSRAECSWIPGPSGGIVNDGTADPPAPLNLPHRRHRGPPGMRGDPRTPSGRHRSGRRGNRTRPTARPRGSPPSHGAPSVVVPRAPVRDLERRCAFPCKRRSGRGPSPTTEPLRGDASISGATSRGSHLWKGIVALHAPAKSDLPSDLPGSCGGDTACLGKVPNLGAAESGFEEPRGLAGRPSAA
jgi:hypothetical protein